MANRQVLYSVKDKDKGVVYQCFNYTQAKGWKVLYENEYHREGKTTLYRRQYC